MVFLFYSILVQPRQSISIDKPEHSKSDMHYSICFIPSTPAIPFAL